MGVTHFPPLGPRSDREAVEAELGRVLASRGFRKSQRRCELIRWLAERSLKGESDSVKEYEIGIAVFGKPESWDPRVDPIVRVELNRVRQKLREYYQEDGRDDAILIEFPPRGYTLIFQERKAVPEPPPVATPPVPRRRWPLKLAAATLLLAAAGFAAMRMFKAPPPVTTVAVLPFMDLTPDGAHEYLSDGLTEELSNSLATIKSLRVVARTSAFQFKRKNIDLREIGRQLGAGAIGIWRSPKITRTRPCGNLRAS